MGWLSCCPCVCVDDSTLISSPRHRSIETKVVTTTSETPIRVKAKPKGPRAYLSHDTQRASIPDRVRTRRTPLSTTDEAVTSKGRRSREASSYEDKDAAIEKQPTRQKPKSSRSHPPRAVASSDRTTLQQASLGDFEKVAYNSSSEGTPPTFRSTPSSKSSPEILPPNLESKVRSRATRTDASTPGHPHSTSTKWETLNPNPHMVRVTPSRKAASTQGHFQKDSEEVSSGINEQIASGIAEHVSVMRKKLQDGTGEQIATIHKSPQDGTGGQFPTIRKNLQDGTVGQFSTIRKNTSDATGEQFPTTRKNPPGKTDEQFSTMRRNTQDATSEQFPTMRKNPPDRTDEHPPTMRKNPQDRTGGHFHTMRKSPQDETGRQVSMMRKNPQEASLEGSSSIVTSRAIRQATKTDTFGEGFPLKPETDYGDSQEYTALEVPAPQKFIPGGITTTGIPATSQPLQRPTIPDRSGDISGGQWPVSMEQSEIESDIHDNLTTFIDDMGLESFFDTEHIRSICQKGAALARNPTCTLNTREDIVDLTKLALYDTIVYCDDSNSMHLGGGKRITSLIEAAKRVTELATMIEPSGVKLRFINLHKDRGLDNICTSSDVNRVMALNKFRGRCSDLGTKLEKTILASSLYDQHREGGLKRPLLITTITDGAPLKEDPQHFRNVILECKRFLAREGYHPKSVVFQVSQVGDAEDADDFITSLHQDPEIHGMVYCTSERLDDKVAELRDRKKDLDRWILDLLSQGIML